MPLLNDFLVGADPEFAIVNGTKLIPFTGRVTPFVPWGTDHNNWVIEPHPKPEKSVKQLVQNLKVAMNDFARVAPTGKWQAGAFIRGDERVLTLGGHIHIDQKACKKDQLYAYDEFTKTLETLDILPAADCERRRKYPGGYGDWSDTRTEHGHFEYRTMASWLFSQRATKICLTGIKLLSVEPEVVTEVLTGQASKLKLKRLFETFQNKDEDADWLLASGILDKKLSFDPTRDLKAVWNIAPEEEKPHWKQAHALQPVIEDPWVLLVLGFQGQNHGFAVRPRVDTFTLRPLLRTWLAQTARVPSGLLERVDEFVFIYRGRQGNLINV